MDNLPQDYYVNSGSRVGRMQQEAQQTHFIDKWDYSHGTERYVKGAKYPQRGRPTAESVWGANQAKVLFMESIKFFKKPQFIFAFIFTWNKVSFIEDLLQRYNKIANRAVSDFFIQRKYQQAITQEIFDMTYDFLVRIGISDETANQTAQIVSFMIEADNAYALRIMDIMSETTKEKLLENPLIEMDRLMLILRERDNQCVADKFKLVQQLLVTLMLIPKYKNAIITTIQNSIFTKLQYDESDRYWAHFREDYKCLGLTFEERQAIVIEKGWKIPFKAQVKHFSAEEMERMKANGEIELTNLGWMMKGVKEQIAGVI